jgi:hypothetical protein
MQHPGNSFCRFHGNPPETLVPEIEYAGTLRTVFFNTNSGEYINADQPGYRFNAAVVPGLSQPAGTGPSRNSEKGVRAHFFLIYAVNVL